MADEITYQLLRAPDLVVLTVTAVGLIERQGPNGRELVSESGAAELIVSFSPQHIAETVPPPSTLSRARLAGPSRLRFEVADNTPIPLSASGILSALGRLRLTKHTQNNASLLELPWRVQLAVDSDTDVRHRSYLATSTAGTTELWHTRLVRRGHKVPPPLYPRAVLPLESGFADGTPLGRSFTFIAEKIAAHPNTPMTVNKLTLTATGACLSGAVNWPGLQWTHQTEFGRDMYVRVVQTGYLFPFGHAAAYVETFERQLGPGNSVAVLKRTSNLVITESTRSFDGTQRKFPFHTVELTPEVLTIDQPTSERWFWPTSRGTPLVFSLQAHVAQEVITMNVPLLFTVPGVPTETLINAYAGGATARTAPKTDVKRMMPIALKSRTEPLAGSVQQVESLNISGLTGGTDVGFQPIITAMQVKLPAVRQLLGQDAAIPVQFADQLLSKPLGAEPDVVLKFAPLRLNFGTARAGVVAAPSMSVDQVSRTLGPIVAQLPTDPKKLFPRDATLLGIVALQDLIKTVTATGRPTITWSGGPHPTATMKWSETLTERVPTLAFAPTTGAECKVALTVESISNSSGRAERPPTVRTHGEITNFTLRVPPVSTLLELDFAKLTFDANSDATPTTAFSIKAARLTGKLRFVQKLQESLPSVSNTAPMISVTATSIRAAFVIAVPTPLSIGVFVVKNLVLKAAVTLSFVNEPVVVEFAWASREQPFLVAVSGFGGGGYLELAIGGSGGGLQRFVGAVEFGACASMDFGVASGEVHVFGGVVFAKTDSGIEITGYLRIGGRVRVLGLITVSVELTLALTYVPNMLTGSAKLVITIDLTFWSTSVEISCSKTFGGSSFAVEGAFPDDPHELVSAGAQEGLSVREALGPDTQSYPWRTYCQTFARE